jgi:type I restriction enzyme S subunit
VTNVADFFVSDAGPIPVGWDASTVGAEFDVRLGKMLDAARNVGEPKPYLGNRSVQWGRIDVNDLGMVPLTRAEQLAFRLRSGDLLVCEGGEVGRAAIWRDQLPECYYQKALHRLRPRAGYSPELMAAYLRLWSDRGALADYVTQTSIAHLPREKLVTVPLPRPPATEQRAIAAALSDVDALLAKLDQMIAKKRDLKQAAMQQLLTGQRRLPGFEAPWTTACIEELADVDPSALPAGTPPGFAFSYISLEDVDRGSLNSWSEQIFATAPSRARRLLKPQDVLVSTVRPNLQSHLLFAGGHGDWVCSTGFAVLRAKPGRASPNFLFECLFSSVVTRQIESMLTGSNYPAINSGDVRRLVVPAPDCDEQAAIAFVLADMGAEVTALEARRDKTRQLKQGMMQALLTGRIRLT